MGKRAGLTKQSLISGAAAAYVGPLVIFWFDLVWRMQTGSDARLCSVDAGQWCTIAEGAAAFLLTFLWALYGFPFALVLTLPCALLVGRLAPMLEREFDVSRIRLVQYSLGTGIGVAVAMLLELATDGKVSLRVVVAGLLAGAAGVFAFRRARYPLSDILISE